MKIFIIFVCICVNFALSEYDSGEILSLSVDGLLMKEASITASSTCGVNGPENYCRLVDEGSMLDNGPGGNVMCDVCDDRNKLKRHPIEYAKSDDQNLWWQSPSMAQGSDYQRVNITIDLKQVYQIVYILLKMADSPRPGTWILERSIDGVQYDPWIFFADTPYSCYNLYQRYNPKIKLTTNARPSSLGDDEVFCTTYYSQPNSLIAGEIIISLINGRQSLQMQDDSTPRSISLTLINFLSARFIRFRFLKPLTLAADLMTHKGHLEKSIYNRYFYSLRNIEVGGKCICNNHADKCDKVVKDGITIAKCNCKHNTCGNNCERCCPLFNQKPWRQGATCEECNCNNKTQQCIFNQTVAALQLSMNKFGQMDGGGVCVGCSENTDGINCEKCRMGYYRPWNVRATQPSPCQLCSCHGSGTVGTCISNGEEMGNQKPGDCICKKGYKGNLCQQCDIGYEYKGGECLPCPCSIDGSVDGSLYQCKPPCNCKVNVDPTDNCHKCKDHFFNLDRTNPEGCQACYCFGITDRCSSLSGRNLKVQSLDHWKVTILAMTKEADPKPTSLLYPIIENPVIDSKLDNPSVYYWQAPQVFLGNWLTSYGSVLQYVIKIELDHSVLGSQIDSADVIIKCGADQLSHSVSSDERRLQRKVQIPMKTKYWRFVTATGSVRESSKDDLMSCLVNVRALLIKGKYYSNQISIGLLNVTLDRGDPGNAISNMPHIEKCNCPPGMSGLSCEACEVGFRRVNDILVRGSCERCECFQHSKSCDSATGHCKNCLHHTAGNFCDICEPGYYGNPRSGDANACKKCACPLADYQLTNMCSTFPPSDYICHECTDKSGGHHCQRCMDGYYGNPMKKIPCQKCQCNDNEESCDSVTGHCRCSFHTTGVHCDICVHGFFGDALKKTCQKCNCSSYGSNSQFCNKTSGLCPCKPNFEGRTCSLCAPGQYLNQERCVPCSCNEYGRVSTAQYCDSMTGKCECHQGVTGSSCDRCLPDYYGFPDCKNCRCSNHSISSECEPINGGCKCGQNVADTKCNNCLNHFYWANRTECASCKCGLGSTGLSCDMSTGQCPCAPNVIGQSCDQCKFNYFGLSPTGCKSCPTCTNGKVCNNEGFCTCPQHTEGENCERCVDQSWGYKKATGCKKCACSPDGSLGQTCDVITGQCLCRVPFTDKKCDKCAANYFGFPKCAPCNCQRDGIVSRGAQTCNIEDGSCSCKTNVEGQRCDRCKPGTFGFNGNYSVGCYSCFCSGLSQECSLQSDFRLISNGQIKFQISSDDQAFVSGKDQQIIKLNGRTNTRFKWPLSFFRPMYADVTQLLTGPDLTLFYGNVLLIANIECESSTCGRERSLQTEAVIESYGGSMELRYLVNHSSAVDRTIVVQMSETSKHGQWFLTRSNNVQLNERVNLKDIKLVIVARELLMHALMNVTKVTVQLYSNAVSPDQIKLNLETFVAVPSKDNVGVPVIGVEKCLCDDKTTGNHCENPIHGYYRVPINISEVLFNVSVRIGFKILKCSCNGHSQECNPATGHCRNCVNNTTGPKCQFCSDGFHGDPQNNGICYKCECPSKKYNFAKKCIKSPLSSKFECQCRDGYEGMMCDRCTEGFFGNPSNGIECKPCSCNPDGSLSLGCDSSGQCACAKGVMGRKCDQCTANYAVEDKTCKDCQTGCTKELFRRVNKLNDTVLNMKWKTLPSKGEMMLKQINVSVMSINNSLVDINRLYRFIEEISSLTNEVRRSGDILKKNLEDATIVKEAYEKALVKIFEISNEINETLSSGKHLQVSKEMINNATAIIKEINDMKQKLPSLDAVERELLSVQDHIEKINKMRREIQSRMPSDRLNTIKDMIAKTRLADGINKQNKEYIKGLHKTVRDFEEKMKQYQQKVNENERDYNETLLKKILLDSQMKELKQLIAGFEQKIGKINEIILEIERLLNNLPKESSSPKDLTIPDTLKEFVNSIVVKSGELVKNLLNGFTLLSRAEDAKQAYSNITKDINDVEEAINSTSRQLRDSRNQLKIDKYSININDILTNHNQIVDTKNTMDSDFQALDVEYNSLFDKSQRFGRDNIEKMSQLPTQTYKVDMFQYNLSSIEKQQNDNQNTIDNLMKTLPSFDLPTSGDVNVTDIKYKVEDLKNQYDEIKRETSSVIGSIKDIRESLKKLRERLQKRKIYTELAHGAAARSPEPIRLDKNCVRHYKTYFLPKSNAFSLEVYLNPQFHTEQNLVLFGYDNSGGDNKSFALTIEKNQKIKFWYDYGTGINDLDIDSSIFVPSKYSGLSITWNLGKWIMKYKSLDEESDPKPGTNSTSPSSINNIFLGPESHIFLGGFPSDGLLRRSNLKLGGQLVEQLKENYRTKFYKGCIYGLSIMNYDLGLQDFHNVEDECIQSQSAYFVLKQNFNCKIVQSNVALVDNFRKTLKRQKRSANTDFNIHFNGHGYVMINTSQVTGNGAACIKLLNKALKLYTLPNLKISPSSFQLVAVFNNYKLNLGFMLGQKNGKFQQAYWKGDETVPIREMKATNDLIVWKVFEKNNDLVFGVDEVCHPESYLYLGGLPVSDTRLREKLIKLDIPYQSYTGSMKMTVVDEELFRKSGTRFVSKVVKKEKQINSLPFYSLMVPTDLSQPILLNHNLYDNILRKGFSLNIDFLGNVIKDEITLITITSDNSKLLLKVSPDLEFTVLLNEEKLSIKVPENDKKWGTYFVVVNIEDGPNSARIDLTVNEPKIKMKEFNLKLDAEVKRIEIGQQGIQQSFYIYDIFLGERLVNFNVPQMAPLPVNAYLKISPSDLFPSMSPPQTISSKTEIPQNDFRSEDYPIDSGWFEGLPGNVLRLNGTIIDKYLKNIDNKISIRIASYSKKPEMILTIAFEPSKTLHVVTVNKQVVLMDPVTKWNATLRVPIINKNWHLIELKASHGSNKGLFVTIDSHSFDFPGGPISFTKPTLIEIGGYNRASPIIYYKGRYHEIGMLTGCLDNFMINTNRVSLAKESVGPKIKECPRVLEFLDVGVEILNSYAMVNDQYEMVKLQLGKYNVTKNKNSVTIEFKFKYTGFEQGSLFVTGDGVKFCAIVIKEKKIHLYYKNFASGQTNSESLILEKDKWYNMEFLIYHIVNTITLFKVKADEKSVQMHLSGSDTLSSDFIRPEIYLGGHPGLDAAQKQSLTNSNKNFVGCISEINVRINKSYVTSSLGQSKYIIPGRCSVDKVSYLRKL